MGDFSSKPVLERTSACLVWGIGLAYRRAARSAVLPRMVGLALKKTIALTYAIAVNNPQLASRRINELVNHVTTHEADQIMVAHHALYLHAHLGITQPQAAAAARDELAFALRHIMAGKDTREYRFSAALLPGFLDPRQNRSDVAVLAKQASRVRTGDFHGSVRQFAAHVESYFGKDDPLGTSYRDTAQQFQKAMAKPPRGDMVTFQEEIELMKVRLQPHSIYFRGPRAAM